MTSRERPTRNVPLDDLALAIEQRSPTELYLLREFLDGACVGLDQNTRLPEVARPLSHLLGALRDALAGRSAQLEGQRFVAGLDEPDEDK